MKREEERREERRGERKGEEKGGEKERRVLSLETNVIILHYGRFIGPSRSICTPVSKA